MKKLAFIIIMPDINKENEKTWETILDDMQLMYDYSNSIKNGSNSISTESRWALGYISWKKLISQNTDKNIDFYFVRTHYKVEEKYTIDDNNIINVCFSKFNHGHIFYKTITALRILKDDYNYFVRGNLNTIIDFNCLSNFLNKCPLTKFFASPLWEGNSYPWGHFILFSNDIAKYLSSIYYLKYYNRIFKEATADDYELTQIVLKKFKYTHLQGCDKAFQPSNMHIVSKLNMHALRIYDTETIDEIINQIKHLDDSVFLFRIKHLKDDSINNFIFLYKFLIDFILNKHIEICTNIKTSIVVSRFNENINWTTKFKNVIIYNKGNKLPGCFNAVLLNNVGREGHTYYTHIYKNYDNLTDYIIFLQGNPFDHSPNILADITKYLNTKNLDISFEFLSDRILNSNLSGCPHHCNLPLINVYEKLFNEHKETMAFTFGSGAQFIVSKKTILKKPKDFYLKIIEILQNDINPIEGFVIERFHKLILN